MTNSSDHDGKSATSSAANAAHYPQQNLNDGHAKAHLENTHQPFQNGPSRDDIAKRAHQIWMNKGGQHGTAEEDWLEAEQELQTGAKSKSLTDEVLRKAGSVQD